MEKLLVGDEIPTGLFGIFDLLELNDEYIIKLLEVLFHVIDKHFSRTVIRNLFEFTVHVLFQLLNILFVFNHLSIVFVHVKFIVQKRSLVLVHMFVQVHSHPSNLTVRFTDFINHLFPKLFMNGLILSQLVRENSNFIFKLTNLVNTSFKHIFGLAHQVLDRVMSLLTLVLDSLQFLFREGESLSKSE